MVDPTRPKTRACEGARDGAAGPVVLAIRLPERVHRTPRVTADLAIGDVRLTFTVARLRNRRLDIRTPATKDGEPAFAVEDDLWEAIKAALRAAVEADVSARDFLRRCRW